MTHSRKPDSRALRYVEKLQRTVQMSSDFLLEQVGGEGVALHSPGPRLKPPPAPWQTASIQGTFCLLSCDSFSDTRMVNGAGEELECGV